jgi:hypothetical protein
MDEADGRPPVELTKQSGAAPPIPPPSPSGPGPGMPAPSGYPAPLPPTPRRISKRRIVAVGVILFLALGGTVGNMLNRKAASHAQVGDCMQLNKLGELKAGATDQDADLDRVDCTEPGAMFKVGDRIADDTGRCPAGDYLEYWERGGDGGDFKLCLTYNLAMGECWEEAEVPVRVPCTVEAGHARFKVVKVLPGVSDPDGCTGAAKGRIGTMSYSRPPQTLCFTAV